MKEKNIEIYYFFTPWCAPCKKQEQILMELEKEYSDIIKFYKIDLDEEKENLKILKINSVPAIVFFKNEVLIHKHEGLQSKIFLEIMIKNLMKS